MRVVSWNVNSLRARLHRVEELLAQHQPDVVLLQETKCAPEQFPHEELAAMGVREPQEVRADEALLRALVGTGAGLVLVGPDDADLEDGIGVVLRYADPATPGRGDRVVETVTSRSPHEGRGPRVRR